MAEREADAPRSRPHVRRALDARGARAALLWRVSRAFTESGLDARARCAVAAREATRLVGDGCIVWDLAEDGSALRPVAIHHQAPENERVLRDLLSGVILPVDENFHATALAWRAPLLVDIRSRADTRTLPLDAYEAYRARFGGFTIIVVPLRAHDRVIGTLAVHRLHSRGPYAPGDAATVWDLAEHAALAIENARLHERVGASREELEGRVRERTRDLEIVNVELDAFNGAVAHDLRNLINVILLHAHVLRGEGLPEAALKRVENLELAAKRMTGTVDALLDLSRAHHAPLKRRDVSLTEVVDEVVARLREKDPERDVRVEVEGGLECRADPRLITLAIENLIVNAWKFTRGRSDAKITVGEVAGATPRAFYVDDNGVGLDTRQATRLFHPFERLESAATFEGTGIGLVTVRRVVERHGGTIRVDGAPGEGARFTFTLPHEA